MSVVIQKRGTPQKVLPHSSEPLKVYSLKLPASAQHFLDALSQEASDHLGWTISSSTIFRVMLTFIQQQPSSWIAKQLHPLIEEEIKQGRVWGTRRKTVLPGEIEAKNAPTPSKPGKGRTLRREKKS